MPDISRDDGSAGHQARRIDLTRTGGFGGFTLRGTIDLDTLPTEQADELNGLVDAVDFGALEGAGATEPRPDEHRYDLRVMAPGRTHHVVVGDSSAPPALHALLARVVALIGTRS